MSRAFTKERDDLPEPQIGDHAAGDPVFVTPAGRALLEECLAGARSAAEARRFAGLLADVVVVEPPADMSVIALGATVDVRGAGVGERRFTVVGSAEADVPAGRVSANSPLGAALLGARAGSTVTWHRPVGDIDLTIEAIRYEP